MNNNSRRKYMQKLYDKEEITDKKSNNSEYDYFMGKNNPPEFYDPYQVIQLSKLINFGAKFSLFVIVVTNFLQLQRSHDIVLSFFINNTSNVDWNLFAWIMATLIFILGVGFMCAIYYFALRSIKFNFNDLDGNGI